MAQHSSPPTEVDPAGTVSDMLDRAKKALDALKKEQKDASRPGPLAVTVMIIVVLMAGAGLVIHTLFEKGGMKVDATSVALLAVVLIAPFVPKLRVIELGGAKAQWQEEAVTSLSEVISVIDYQNQALERLYADSIAQAQAAEDVELAPSLVTVPSLTALLPPRSIRHVLWVDDNPVNNSYELEALRTIAKVTVVTDTARALRVLQVEDIDAMISDIGRVESGQNVKDAGLRLLRAAKNLHLGHAVPILFYSSSEGVERYGAALEAEGAMAVTTSHRELFGALRASEIQATRYTVRSVIQEHRGLTLMDDSDAGVDYVIALPEGPPIGVEIGAWVTRPQMSAFADRVNRLVEARDGGHIGRGWLVVREEVIDSRRRALAADKNVHLLSLTAVRDALHGAIH